MEDFAQFIAKQRDELQRKRNALTVEAARIESDIAIIDREFAAIAAYEAAKTGTVAKATTGTPRPRRGNVRDTVIAAIKAAPTGINRSDLLVQLGAKGDKAAEQSISNALANLKKAGTIDAKDGAYTMVAG